VIDRAQLEAVLAGAEPSELVSLGAEIQGRGLVALAASKATTPEAEPLLDSRSAAEFLGVAPYYVEQLARERRIPCVRLAGTARSGRQREGRKVRFRISDLTAWAEAHVDSGNGR
jgi:hypothetical protein